MRKRVYQDERAALKAKMSDLGAVAAAFKSFRPEAESFTRVKAVPTIFPGFDHGVRVGGFPLERIALVHGPSGQGKAVANDTPVLTPRGWVLASEICVGDNVIAGDGSPTRVLGVFPQGKKPLFKVTFDDGTSVECCEEHLWFTTTLRERAKGRYVRGPRPIRQRIPTGVDGAGTVKSLAEIREGFRPREHAVPLAGVAAFEPKGDLPLDPYLLGLYLGDGGSTTPNATFHKPEDDLRREFTSRIPDGDEVVDVSEMTLRVRGPSFRGELRRLELWGCRSWEKFVPELYLFGSPDERLALLRGLLDTDGSVVQDGGAVEYSSSSFRLADDVAFLARSLGGYVSEETRQTSFTYKGEKKKGRPSRRLRIYFDNGLVPVVSWKNLAKWKGRGQRRQFRTIVSIEPSRFDEAVCFRVEHPSRLFVIKDFVVTHNTFFTLGVAQSFLRLDRPVLFVDAERTLEEGFIKLGLGSEFPRHHVKDEKGEWVANGLWLPRRPGSYEATRLEVRNFCNTVAGLRKKTSDMTGLVVIDSIRKLVPEEQWEKIQKLAKASDKEKARDRSAQIKALMNAAWCDELIPLLEQTGTAMIIIARETDDPDADPRMKRYGLGVKTGGGSALYYDASLDIRIDRQRYVTKSKDEGMKPDVYGERHRITIKKSKVAGKEDKTTICFFHTSNGKFVPAGFDRARDVLDLARAFQIVKGESWLKWKQWKFQGEHSAVKRLSSEPKVLDALEAEVRSRFLSNKPLEISADGEVLDE